MARIPSLRCQVCQLRMRRAYVRQAGATLNGYRPIGWACLEGHWAEGDRQIHHAKNLPTGEPPRETYRVITDQHAIQVGVAPREARPVDSET